MLRDRNLQTVEPSHSILYYVRDVAVSRRAVRTLETLGGPGAPKKLRKCDRSREKTGEGKHEVGGGRVRGSRFCTVAPQVGSAMKVGETAKDCGFGSEGGEERRGL